MITMGDVTKHKERIKELEEALRPFAEESRRLLDVGYTESDYADERMLSITSQMGSNMTYGDFRRARAVLEKGE